MKGSDIPVTAVHDCKEAEGHRRKYATKYSALLSGRLRCKSWMWLDMMSILGNKRRSEKGASRLSRFKVMHSREAEVGKQRKDIISEQCDGTTVPVVQYGNTACRKGAFTRRGAWMGELAAIHHQATVDRERIFCDSQRKWSARSRPTIFYCILFYCCTMWVFLLLEVYF